MKEQIILFQKFTNAGEGGSFGVPLLEVQDFPLTLFDFTLGTLAIFSEKLPTFCCDSKNWCNSCKHFNEDKICTHCRISMLHGSQHAFPS